MLDNALMVLTGKGGVGKTSLVAHTAGLVAASEWRVLAVDLDQQGNLARDLGYVDRSDGGKGLLEAVVMGNKPGVITDVRPGLDVIPGGPSLTELADVIGTRAARAGEEALDRLELSLDPVTSQYDLVILDMPPGESWLSRAAMRFCRQIVVPTKTDEGSFDGVSDVYARIHAQRDRDIRVLGVALMLVTPSAKAVVREARQALEAALGEAAPVFDHTVRYAEAAAVDCRRRGVLAFEYEGIAAAAKARRLEMLRKKQRPTERVSSAAAGLADDYQQLGKEIIEAWLNSMREFQA